MFGMEGTVALFPGNRYQLSVAPIKGQGISHCSGELPLHVKRTGHSGVVVTLR